jgi:hypothetical protein
MQKLVWRLKLDADSGAGNTTEIEVARIGREAWADPERLGLSLSEGKRLTAAIQSEMVRVQATIMGDRFRCCARCGSATGESLFDPCSATCRSGCGRSSVAGAAMTSSKSRGAFRP